ncbi:MAG TPA: metallophosphoesterase [Polyangia bacterium]|nr:metallophosphoesterase [Polyangia bacterium]
MFNRSLPLLVLAAASCSAPTTYDLVAATDTIRYQVANAPEDWATQSFDDSKWATLTGAVGPLAPGSDGAMPTVYTRRRFDLGPQFDGYQNVTLKVQTSGKWTAYLNGVAWTGGDGSAPTATLTVSPGVLQASGNVLAVAIHPSDGVTSLAILPTLDGVAKLPAGSPPQIIKGPWLVAPTQDGITVVWETDQPAPSQAIVDGKAFDGGADAHHVAHVTGLSPSQSYPYHVEVGAAHSEDGTLSTAARPGERVRFVVYGDNRTDGDAHRRVVEAIQTEGPDFLVNTGDLVDSSSDAEWQSFFNLEYNLVRRTPLVPALGNHESDSGGGPRYDQLFPYGDQSVFGGTVYGFDYGDVHIAVLNSNGALDAQAKWLDADLTAAEQRGAKHEFVVMHWGPYSSGTTINHGVNDDAKSFISPVAKAHHVEATLAGHDHFYERGASDALAYFVTGGGGAPLEGAGKIRETLFSQSLHHYLVIDVSGGQAQVSARDLNGNTFDSVTLSR